MSGQWEGWFKKRKFEIIIHPDKNMSDQLNQHGAYRFVFPRDRTHFIYACTMCIQLMRNTIMRGPTRACWDEFQRRIGI